jgi:hypothetical protein
MRTALLAIMLTFAACGNKQDKANEEATKAQTKADDKAIEAAKAQKEADDKAVTAKQTADAADAKALADARDRVHKDFDAADRKLASFKEKVVKATGTQRKNADAAAAEADTREAAARTSLAKLDAVAATDLTAAKTQADADIAALDKSIDSVESTLK